MKKKKEINKGKHVPRAKSHLIPYLLFLIIVPAVLYFRVVNFGFSNFDDNNINVNISEIGGNKLDLKAAFTHDAFMSNTGDVYYRPIQTVSFMIDAIIGGEQSWVYHLSNLLLHILTVITLFFFLKKTGIKQEIALLLSLFFSISPMFTNAVAWIPARGDLLLSLFSLLSFITFLKYFEKKKIVYLFLHSLVFLLAVFSKEMAILLPALILSYYYFAVKNEFRIKEISLFLVIWIFSIMLFYVMRQYVVKIVLPSSMFGVIPFIKNLPAIPVTIGKFFIPYNLSTLPLFDTLSIIIGVFVLTSLSIITVKYIRGKEPVVIWGFIWFLLFTIPPMLFRTFKAEYAYEYFEYRTYFPMIGILIVVGSLTAGYQNKFSFKGLLKAAIPVLFVYALIAYIHTNDFSDSISFFTSAIESNSKDALGYTGRGSEYLNSNQYAKALSDYDNSISTCPEFSEPYFRKGVIYTSVNDHVRAEQFYSLALKYDTLYPADNVSSTENSYIHLAVEKMMLKKYDEAISLLKKALRNNPENGMLHNDLGLAYSYSGKIDSAQYEYNMARKFGYKGKNEK